MAAPLEQFGSERNPARLRRQIHLARLARAREAQRDHEGWSRAAMLLLLPILVAPILALVALGVTAMRFYDDTVANLDTPANMLAAVANYGGAQVYDRNGVLLYRFPESDGSLRLPARLDNVSKAMIDATVSTEDDGFWEHGGLDFRGTLGAAYENMRTNGNPFSGRGGSGITQQLVKQTLIAPEDRTSQSVTRKLQEAIYATQIANSYSREQILEWYLNITNYGGVYNGVETAAQGYFGIPASQLSLAQAAMLAGIPQSPAQHSPYLNPEGAKWRQGEVLDLMVAHGDITQQEADAAKAEKITIQTSEDSLPLRAPWFVEHVRRELVERFGERCVARCGLSVTTTLDITLQEQAQATLDKNLTTHADPIGAHNGAVVSIDARSGEILVMVGSRDYNDASPVVQGSNNFATAVLQPGSAFKPFVYLSLFMKKGYGPSSIIFDEPFVTSDGYACKNPGTVARNYGPVPVRIALGSSLNCTANRAAEVVGVPDILTTARTMGIGILGDASQYGPSIATGGANITLLDLAYGYTTLARNGSMVGATGLRQDVRPLDPVSLRKVTDATDRTLFSFEPKHQQVIKAEHAYLVNSILSDCTTRRMIWDCSFPTFRLSDGRQVAGKTGTQQGTILTQSNANWLFLYTPELVTGGWVGNANRTGWTDVNGAANAVGYTVQKVEDTILQAYKMPAGKFTRPAGIVEANVFVPDGTQGLISGCGPTEKGLFVSGSAPDQNNRICVNGVITVPSEQLGSGGLKGYVPQATPTPTSSAFIAPAPGATVNGGVLVLVRAPAGQKIEIQWGAGAAPTSWRGLATSSISSGEYYAGWDTSGLAPGPYSLRMMMDDKPVSAMVVQVGSGGGAVPSGTPTPPVKPTATPPPVRTPLPSATVTPSPTPTRPRADSLTEAAPTATPTGGTSPSATSTPAPTPTP